MPNIYSESPPPFKEKPTKWEQKKDKKEMDLTNRKRVLLMLWSIENVVHVIVHLYAWRLARNGFKFLVYMILRIFAHFLFLANWVYPFVYSVCTWIAPLCNFSKIYVLMIKTLRENIGSVLSFYFLFLFLFSIECG